VNNPVGRISFTAKSFPADHVKLFSGTAAGIAPIHCFLYARINRPRHFSFRTRSGPGRTFFIPSGFQILVSINIRPVEKLFSGDGGAPGCFDSARQNVLAKIALRGRLIWPHMTAITYRPGDGRHENSAFTDSARALTAVA